ncbi:phospholipase C, phosphocholine-specific [Thermomonas sp. HDW16]|uniref:phosphocholine-specific phospholipase C n=1 Tax=Thermomonas sp. HDW16 TaxID=2714945 RepID=UPI001409047A|nr:phospholipase C, phosphocholine-specific [Thermomonas sp. HDW16]QIL21105.1 phospholipase C, phosphocholine-specific [Thermomonas sp. HDW16]
MVSERRRHFLKLSAAAAAGTIGVQLLPKVIRDAIAVEPAVVTGTIQDVQHVVILMQENRSFDHYLAALRGVRGFDDPRPIPLPGGGTVWQQPDRIGGKKVTLPFHLDTGTTAAQCLSDIDHNWKRSHALWKNHDAWVQVKGPFCMGHFTREDLPFYYAVADAFTVCDAYYCSIFGPTNPNRMHMFAGTSGLTVGNSGMQAVGNKDDGNWTADMSRDDPDFVAYTWGTYAERLQDAGVSWKVYQEYDNYGDNSLQNFANFRNLPASSPLYQRGRAWVAGSIAENASASRGEYLVSAFKRDVEAGTLPQVSWLVPPYIMSEHPEASPAYGESLTSRLLEVLAANPAVWSKTVFIVNYDENGGFFDHVPAPLPAIERSMGLSTVDTGTENYNGVPVGLGPRTPMFVISPWSKGGWVNSQVFDHTSTIRFLERRFGVMEPNISEWRRAVCGDLTTAMAFAHPDVAWPALPNTSGNIGGADAACMLAKPRVPAEQAMPRQERGRRPARALPYDLQVDGRPDTANGLYWLDFINTGAAGACFNVYSLNRDDGPWFYTVEAGKRLSDYWNAAAVSTDKYDLRAFGPNGFLREFRGNLLTAGSGHPQPEVQVRYDTAGGRILLRLHNAGNAACILTVTPNLYSAEPARIHPLPAGATIDDAWSILDGDHWYDLSIASDSDTDFLRRLAGHMETGLASISDPAIGA